ncbi:MAG: rhodanese-like domain-containing protein [Clostridia bacterium]|nr:rhodanese-like domain-containing protein [Clostridia bacterium]
MFKKSLILIIMAVAIFLLSLGCDKEPGAVVDDNEKKYHDVLMELVESTNKFIANREVPVFSASEIFEKVIMRPDPNYYIVDLRESEDFLAGSIQGAVNIPYNTTWMPEQIEKLPRDKLIILVGYTGAEASQTAAFWGMLEFDVGVMNNGMLGWINETPEVCELGDNPVVTTPTGLNQTFSLPVIEVSGHLSLNEVLILKNESIFQNNRAGGLSGAQVYEKNLEEQQSYFILDVRQREHYLSGHIEGAVNIPYGLLGIVSELQKLPTDEQIIVVCYSGHLANMAARLLNQLGYNAIAMTYGMSDWTTQVEVIGLQPVRCAWVSCYGDANFERGFPVEKVECDWGNLPTVVTRINVLDTGAG